MNAPVIVFAYNRPAHLQKTLHALAQNDGAGQTDVFVFIDGPKTQQGKAVQNEVLRVAKCFEGSFQSLAVTVSSKNKGLASSVISGVSEVMAQCGRAIVVEDDAVSARGFLCFMNSALDFYRDDPTVWSVGGYTVPVSLPADYRCGVIKTQRASSYAWATWADRWNAVDWSVGTYGSFRKNLSERRRFNRWGNDRAGMLDSQMRGEIDSWAIRFDYAMFRRGMFNIVPAHSLIQTIGHDGSGTHSKGDSSQNDAFAVALSDAPDCVVPEHAEPDERIRKAFCKPFYLPRRYRLKKYAACCLTRKK